ncbi:MAG: hypothetical protein FRX48_06377 [Lasallia pustulata]|uniref:Uncharacterized protein n=1 Tax=Lasallia pustulata TaxID=136370 RepID=A0A5M8PLD9_9LECA|nr:MAG: hypothetical protein FRX48_06377 [Lasallia pustulata]
MSMPYLQVIRTPDQEASVGRASATYDEHLPKSTDNLLGQHLTTYSRPLSGPLSGPLEKRQPDPCYSK